MCWTSNMNCLKENNENDMPENRIWSDFYYRPKPSQIGQNGLAAAADACLAGTIYVHIFSYCFLRKFGFDTYLHISTLLNSVSFCFLLLQQLWAVIGKKWKRYFVPFDLCINSEQMFERTIRRRWVACTNANLRSCRGTGMSKDLVVPKLLRHEILPLSKNP